ncbi:hypothetical protein HanPI659440_Chr09g0319491 [Helianthus annuus]|nr:hypothetical protein HanPI659440_Chr09g0319491 [Helianthus annuus]
MAINDLVGMMVALVLNKPFNISKYIFANMKENLGRTGVGGSKFWMYPRFLQMIMNVQHPNLPKADNDVLKIDAMMEHSLKIFRGVASKRYTESTPPRKMFGALRIRNTSLRQRISGVMMTANLTMKNQNDESDNGDGDDEGRDRGDGGNVCASGARVPGGDNDESDSDDNPPEPGYEHYFDDHGVRQVRQIRMEQDVDCVPSDTEAERLKKKKVAVRRQKRSKKTIGTSSAQPSATQYEPMTEPVLEADLNSQFAFTEAEIVAMMTYPKTATATPPVTTTVAETPLVTPQAEPQHATSSIHQHRYATH